jgi:phosphotriesterase-related protein
MSDDINTIVTVDGRINPDELGVTLPHEHLFADWTDRYEPPESAYERKVAEEPVSLENLWYVEKNPFTHKDNLRLNSFQEAVDEISIFHRMGGDAIVDMTPKNTSGDPEQVRSIARETGLNIIHGTAFYTRDSHPKRVDNMSVEDVADEFEDDVLNGIGKTDVRAGIIGEIGLSGHIHSAEEKVLRAGARAALRTGAPIAVHPPGRTEHSQRNRTYPSSRWGLKILDILEDEGLQMERANLCHMDRTRWYENLDYQREICRRGGYVEYDLFGQRRYHYRDEYNDASPSDVQRVEWLAELVEDGFEENLLLSQDVFLKSHRQKHGGFGYAHILDNIVPILEDRGIADETIYTLLVENPKRLLTFTKPNS